MDLSHLRIDYVSISSHKIFGPKGVAALVASPGMVKPFIRGGGQENRRRADRKCPSHSGVRSGGPACGH